MSWASSPEEYPDFGAAVQVAVTTINDPTVSAHTDNAPSTHNVVNGDMKRPRRIQYSNPETLGVTAKDIRVQSLDSGERYRDKPMSRVVKMFIMHSDTDKVNNTHHGTSIGVTACVNASTLAAIARSQPAKLLLTNVNPMLITNLVEVLFILFVNEILNTKFIDDWYANSIHLNASEDFNTTRDLYSCLTTGSDLTELTNYFSYVIAPTMLKTVASVSTPVSTPIPIPPAKEGSLAQIDHHPTPVVATDMDNLDNFGNAIRLNTKSPTPGTSTDSSSDSDSSRSSSIVRSLPSPLSSMSPLNYIDVSANPATLTQTFALPSAPDCDEYGDVCDGPKPANSTRVNPMSIPFSQTAGVPPPTNQYFFRATHLDTNAAVYTSIRIFMYMYKTGMYEMEEQLTAWGCLDDDEGARYVQSMLDYVWYLSADTPSRPEHPMAVIKLGDGINVPFHYRITTYVPPAMT